MGEGIGPVQILSKRLNDSEDQGEILGGMGGMIVGVGGIMKRSWRVTTDEGRVIDGISINGMPFSVSAVVLG